ncbi:hypothetical protein Aph01nite_01660 [Acrocarpospora phusangensis]|uniref:Uncharacterized protein n=1 Tax=Acrocarpospora phusangensis TaxID=1070424 RepID=A0A919UHS3_9ACTN|nr:hypothetical protein [Acrocarpospora phusangensis]GIH21856.1 hypothetical protein Aph01nite_01660 [Acrocarpospora phusangensis]
MRQKQPVVLAAPSVLSVVLGVVLGVFTPLLVPQAAMAAPGNPAGGAYVPAEARAVTTSRPDRVVGNGTPASCTSRAVVAAVAKGGVITFNCGPRPVVIRMTATAKVRNTSARVVLDGGGKVTLSGMGQRRILYMNTCDKSLVWTTSHCDNQSRPQLVLQNLTFADGNATGEKLEGGGGAVFVRGGRVKVVNSTFIRNRCDSTGPDVGGAALRVLSQYRNLPVYVVRSTFGGAKGQGGVCSNGGAVSSIGVSWVILNSVMSYNKAIGRGANPARGGTPGGGSGGAIYTDGNRFTVRVAGSVIQNNTAREGGGAVFFVSNDMTGTLRIEKSRLRNNPSAGFETRGFPGIFFKGAGKPQVVASTLR